MFGRFARISVIALAGLAATQFIPSSAMAQYNDDEGYGQPRWSHRQDQNWDRPRDWDQGGCSRRDLVDAARAEGFRRIDSIQMNGRRIVVRGWNDGGPDRMSFANRRGCPVID
jgi:Ni/Co efflux regulator RcnB